MTGMWHPDAWVAPGPLVKTGYVNIPQRDWRGAVLHSMEGPIGVALTIVQGVVPVSWHFSVPKHGDGFYQHYPLSAVCWHGGGPGANRRFFGIEHEGVTGELLTEHQIECDVAILAWAADNDVMPWPSFTQHDTLWEHREMTEFGSAATSCPSGRIPWDEVIDMTMLFEQLKARLTAVETGKNWQQGALDLHKQQIADLITVKNMHQAALNDHEARIGTLEEKK